VCSVTPDSLERVEFSEKPDHAWAAVSASVTATGAAKRAVAVPLQMAMEDR